MREWKMPRIQMRALLVLSLLVALIAACAGRSRDLIVRVTEKDGTAIPEASVTLVATQDVQVTDEAGEVAWSDIEEESAILYVAAEGYTTYAGKWDLERGSNEAVIALEREPIDPDLKGP
jgi:hypothetical protein